MADHIIPTTLHVVVPECRRAEGYRRTRLMAIAIAVLMCNPMAITVQPLSAEPHSGHVRNHAPPRDDRPTHKQPIFYPPSASPAETAEALAAEAPDALLERFMHLHSTMRYDEALRVAERLVALRPDSGLALYNLACIQARLHLVDEAIVTLKRAVESGWRRLTHLELDPDLQCLRDDDRFAAIITTLETRLAAEAPTSRSRRDDPWPAIARELEQRVPDWLREYEVPGVSIALLRDGDVVWESGMGAACAASGEAMTAETPFPVRVPATLATLVAAVHCNPDAERQYAALIELADQSVAVEPRRATRFAAARHEFSSRRFATSSPTSRRSGVQPVHRRSHSTEPVRTNDPAASESDISADREARRHAELLHMLVELSSNRSSRAYCESEVFVSSELTATTFPHPDAMSGLATGHTALGTALAESDQAPDDNVLYSTAPDLARLLARAAMVGAADDAVDAAGHRDLAARVIAMIRSGQVLPRRIIRTDGGLRYEIAEHWNGRGCLMQWHPHGGDGIVVLYNAAHGEALARRIARHALGGEARRGS